MATPMSELFVVAHRFLGRLDSSDEVHTTRLAADAEAIAQETAWALMYERSYGRPPAVPSHEVLSLDEYIRLREEQVRATEEAKR